MGKGSGPNTHLKQKMKMAQSVPKALDGKASGGKMRKRTMLGLKALKAPKAIGVQKCFTCHIPMF